MTPYDPNQHIQIVTKPGGLSGAAHAVHILITLFTCGLWLIPYLVIAGAAPRERIEVVAPYGADPALVAAARAQAIERSKTSSVPPGPAPGTPLTRSQIAVRIVVYGILAAMLVGFLVMAYTST
jgi:hypothetical protein